MAKLFKKEIKERKQEQINLNNLRILAMREQERLRALKLQEEKEKFDALRLEKWRLEEEERLRLEEEEREKYKLVLIPKARPSILMPYQPQTKRNSIKMSANKVKNAIALKTPLIREAVEIGEGVRARKRRMSQAMIAMMSRLQSFKINSAELAFQESNLTSAPNSAKISSSSSSSLFINNDHNDPYLSDDVDEVDLENSNNANNPKTNFNIIVPIVPHKSSSTIDCVIDDIVLDETRFVNNLSSISYDELIDEGKELGFDDYLSDVVNNQVIEIDQIEELKEKEIMKESKVDAIEILIKHQRTSMVQNLIDNSNRTTGNGLVSGNPLMTSHNSFLNPTNLKKYNEEKNSNIDIDNKDEISIIHLDNPDSISISMSINNNSNLNNDQEVIHNYSETNRGINIPTKPRTSKPITENSINNPSNISNVNDSTLFLKSCPKPPSSPINKKKSPVLRSSIKSTKVIEFSKQAIDLTKANIHQNDSNIFRIVTDIRPKSGGLSRPSSASRPSSTGVYFGKKDQTVAKTSTEVFYKLPLSVEIPKMDGVVISPLIVDHINIKVDSTNIHDNQYQDNQNRESKNFMLESTWSSITNDDMTVISNHGDYIDIKPLSLLEVSEYSSNDISDPFISSMCDSISTNTETRSNNIIGGDELKFITNYSLSVVTYVLNMALENVVRMKLIDKKDNINDNIYKHDYLDNNNVRIFFLIYY